MTGNRRLYNAVKDRLPWVLWIEDYAPQMNYHCFQHVWVVVRTL